MVLVTPAPQTGYREVFEQLGKAYDSQLSNLEKDPNNEQPLVGDTIDAWLDAFESEGGFNTKRFENPSEGFREILTNLNSWSILELTKGLYADLESPTATDLQIVYMQSCAVAFLIRQEFFERFIAECNEGTFGEKGNKITKEDALFQHLLLTNLEFSVGVLDVNDIENGYLLLAGINSHLATLGAQDPKRFEEVLYIVNNSVKKRRSALNTYRDLLDLKDALDTYSMAFEGLRKGLRSEVITELLIAEIIPDLEDVFKNDSKLSIVTNITLEKASSRDDAYADVDFYLVGTINGAKIILAGIDVRSEEIAVHAKTSIDNTDQEPNYTFGVLTANRVMTSKLYGRTTYAVEVFNDRSAPDYQIKFRTQRFVERTGISVVGIRVPNYLLDKDFGNFESSDSIPIKDLSGIVRGQYPKGKPDDFMDWSTDTPQEKLRKKAARSLVMDRQNAVLESQDVLKSALTEMVLHTLENSGDIR